MHTPLGDLSIAEEGGVIVSVDWGWCRDQVPSPLLEMAITALDAFFSGDRQLPGFPLAPAPTPFQARLRQIACDAAPGHRIALSCVSHTLAATPQSVGAAIGRNPIPLFVPCHRIGNSRGWRASVLKLEQAIDAHSNKDAL